ncbi:hypothetical protein GCM10017567_08990 [Amycolatopsis bullii]|uniref:Uncharacterized protein n=2 Tax=Amycolatopsis TaxID=1813 RepID=A0ABQ3K214_9PSEU|nr:hypothetical protein GCM10017567_08990 [Amycolatopsis bullii]
MFGGPGRGHLVAMAEAGITEMTGRAGVVAALRRVLLAFGVGGALACLAWMALWLAMHV